MTVVKKFWIKERYNPQLGTYYVPCGQLSNTAARRQEKSLYGYNTMHEYDTEEEYNNEIARLKSSGENVHG